MLLNEEGTEIVREVIHLGKKQERETRLLEILKEQNGITIKELSQILSVSEMTIRRDLEQLKERNIILNVPGVAILNANNTFSEEEVKYELSSATRTRTSEKERIGRYAASLVEKDDCIIIDNGSTVEYLTDNVDKDMNMTVFTCNLNILNKICNNVNTSIIFGGGYYHPDTALFESPENIALIRKIRATKVFASAAGVHHEMGITCMNNYEIEIKQAIIQSGAEKILLVDSSKFGLVRPCFVTEIDVFDRIITDSNISEEWMERIKTKGIILDIV